ncbi:cytochrome o ubiquinol oxidase subunit IV [Candidatus Tachikawaea gelatinosa]|uniref:Cytochrome bo(3) ubiquinol oxidase subunit 4 n=1 Tax=Candidatus Tachikawaea gelatinosa TaxID=1410383 RepID=A0A090AR43_9ENTR|nr:cytochrome o ubiquinol oxidase subunit IV [Candidatus Tachikawaea gelatinosa]BAP58822.1 cytochrome o ubiquinol oxidase protein CyoD (Ubiquinol oxidase chain D) [Candidatus Tachikawaea gelatinosa]
MHKKSCDTQSKFKYFKSYLLGFLYSIILTIIPFFIAINNQFSKKQKLFTIIVCAIFQILVHSIFFLHINKKDEEKWNLVTILFCFIIVMIIFFGSLWIMYHLNYNMMSF